MVVVGATSATTPSSSNATASTRVCFIPRISVSRVVARTDGPSLLCGNGKMLIRARRAPPWPAPPSPRHPSLGDPAGGTLPPSTTPVAVPTRTATGQRARGAARSRREPGDRGEDGEHATLPDASTSACSAPRWGTMRPRVSRHAGPACSLFADPRHFPGNGCASGHSTHPLNVSECRLFTARHVFYAAVMYLTVIGTCHWRLHGAR